MWKHTESYKITAYMLGIVVLVHMSLFKANNSKKLRFRSSCIEPNGTGCALLEITLNFQKQTTTLTVRSLCGYVRSS